MLLDFRNTNTLWASVLTETLARLGLKTAVISPGSRSTPLTVSLAAHPDIEAIPVLDERSAGFFALGIAQRTGKPVVLVCTSGTAGANYFPAVIEARESSVPLLLLTADRPSEMRDCASGQTIDQQKLYGSFANAYSELALPTAEMAMLRYLRQTIAHLWQSTQTPPGPVHVNCPFRDPLAPVTDGTAAALESAIDKTFFDGLGDIHPGKTVSGTARARYDQTIQGIIVVGPTAARNAKSFCQQVAQLSEILQWPVLAEGLSPLRSYASLNPHLITTYDLLLRQPAWAQALAPEQVIQIGPLPTSKVLRQWLTQTDPKRWIVSDVHGNLDPLHGRAVSAGSLADFLAAAAPSSLPSSMESTFLNAWLSLERRIRRQLDAMLAAETGLMESKIPWQLAQSLPAQTPVFVANSLAVRDVEWFWPATDGGYEIYFNRGANGIDGTLSSALGVAHGHRLPAVLLSGDLALLHDTNGFLSAARLRGHLTVVVINNRGGGIFERLPIAQFEPPFEEFFATPQPVDWERLCGAYGVEHRQIESWLQLQRLLGQMPTAGVRVLEIECDRKASHQYRQALLNKWALGEQ